MQTNREFNMDKRALELMYKDPVVVKRGVNTVKILSKLDRDNLETFYSNPKQIQAFVSSLDPQSEDDWVACIAWDIYKFMKLHQNRDKDKDLIPFSPGEMWARIAIYIENAYEEMRDPDETGCPVGCEDDCGVCKLGSEGV